MSERTDAAAEELRKVNQRLSRTRVESGGDLPPERIEQAIRGLSHSVNHLIRGVDDLQRRVERLDGR